MLTTTHRQITIRLKDRECEVDEGMVGTLSWLNGYSGVQTLWSCEGGRIQDPYVSFRCTDQDDLIALLKRLHPTDQNGDSLRYAVCEVDEHEGSPRYCIKWSNTPTFLAWQQKVGIVVPPSRTADSTATISGGGGDRAVGSAG
jgi:hypothetical protein